MPPLVSILMPVYKTAPYLKEAMDSMLAQTFEDFELIVLNDCSPDNAEEILDTYSDTRIVRYKAEKNCGLANILNIGMGMARGKYIARMDSDDISLPERLHIQVKYLESHLDVDLCSCGMRLFGTRNDVWIRDFDMESVKFRALFHSPILHASSVWRDSSFRDLRFNQSFVPAEDYELWTRALVSGCKMVNLPQVLYLYRTFPQQATANVAASEMKSIEVRKRYLEMIFPQANKEQIDNLSRMNDIAAQNSDDLRGALDELMFLNESTQYFDLSIADRCNRFYQNCLYNEMCRNGINWGKLSNLRIKQIGKLLLKKHHNKKLVK